MKQHRNFMHKTAIVAAFSLLCSQAQAAGYEKSIIWGGRSAGVAGIATPYVSGAEALYFNPAGLVSDRVGQEVSFDITPTWSQFKGPINNQNEVVESDRKLSTPFGLIYSATLNEKLGFGFGGYISGGSAAKYEDVAFTGFNGSPDVETDLVLAEIAAGVGYKVTDDLKLGLAWRVVTANANFSFVKRNATGTTVTNLKVKDLEDTQYTGFKLGAQYDLGEKTKLGFSYRSEIDLSVEGKADGYVYSAAPSPTALAEHKVEAETTFPMAATLGVQHELNEDWRILGEYVWTNYAQNEKIVLTDKDATPGYSTELQQDWKDQHNIRLAGEYLGAAWPVRFGYVWTSQVTADDYARAAFTPPGAAHTLTVGSGTEFGESFRFDAGVEYTMVEGDGPGAAAGAAAGDIRAGKYEAESYALHLGLNYYF